MDWLDRICWWIAMAGVVTLGLAPFTPEPHLWEKLKLVGQGASFRPIDIFDFVLHAAPWLVAVLKLLRMAKA